jgi:hypothetical protein
MEQNAPMPTGFVTALSVIPTASNWSKLISSHKSSRGVNVFVSFSSVTGAPALPDVNFAVTRHSVANTGLKQHNPTSKMKILMKCLNMVNIPYG